MTAIKKLTKKTAKQYKPTKKDVLEVATKLMAAEITGLRSKMAGYIDDKILAEEAIYRAETLLKKVYAE